MSDDNKLEQRSNDIISKWNEQAEEAVAAADVAGLRKLVREAGEINKKYAQAFNGMISVLTPSRESRSPESESAIAAMREVALAAIDLAKAYASDRASKP
jgi:hypothetical protein